MSKSDPEELLTLREIAAMLRIHPNTVRRLVKSEGMPAIRLGGQLRFPPSAFRDYLQGKRTDRQEVA